MATATHSGDRHLRNTKSDRLPLREQTAIAMQNLRDERNDDRLNKANKQRSPCSWY
ncbi:hypothetical protein ACN4EK_10570 [Pantanalinema rosaneae CENA516]|uniref:hypothetical protein n=1 Tax=Pantanalinema rosaneae TaxID=1620701 RepID=UPI003D6E11AB